MEFGSIFGALVSGVGIALQYSAQQEANQIAWRNLQFQQRMARDQFDLASAARTDAYGNKQSYNPYTKEWKIALTPTQNQIIKAGETEQLKSLTEDATRNRILSRQKFDRAQQAREGYNDALAGYEYDQPPSEAAIRSQILDALTFGAQQAKNATQDTLTKQALRLGRGADIPKIIQQGNEALGSRLQDLMAKSRDAARGEFVQRSQLHDQKYLPEIQAFDRIMQEAGPQQLQGFSNVPQQLQAMQGQQASAIEEALSRGASEVGGAYSQLANALGKSPDFSGLAKAFSGFGGGGGGGGGRKTKASGGNNPGWFTPVPISGGSGYDTFGYNYDDNLSLPAQPPQRTSYNDWNWDWNDGALF